MKGYRLYSGLTMAVILLALHWYIPQAAAETVINDTVVAQNQVGLPKTGQETSYSANDDATYANPAGADIGCVKGKFTWANWNADGGRFTKESGSPPSSGTVVDNATGLEWIANPSDAGIGSVTSWALALTVIEGLSYAGHDDWRLPNINELISLSDFGIMNPAIDTNFFTCANSNYWSSTTYLQNTGYAFIWGAPQGVDGWDVKTTTNYIRPVRGGGNKN